MNFNLQYSPSGEKKSIERLLLIGGSGFIGINVMEYFLKIGIQIYNYDCCNMANCVGTYFGQLGGDYHFIQGDILDRGRLQLSLEESGADTVIHMAVITVTGDRGKNDTRHTFDVNCEGALNMLDVSVATGIRHFLCVSSIAAYGTTAYKAGILAEEMENLSPESLYQVSKLTSEELALRYQYLHHISITCTKLGGVFGLWERPTKFRDKMSTPYITLKYAMDGIQTVLKRPGRTSRVYSRNTAGAPFWLAGRSPEQDVYNLSSGGIQSVMDRCQALCSYYPGFKWRLAGREEKSNVFYRDIRDDAPMSVSRLCEFDYTLQCDMEEAMKDYIA